MYNNLLAKGFLKYDVTFLFAWPPFFYNFEKVVLSSLGTLRYPNILCSFICPRTGNFSSEK